jgi:hypothetical protein
VGHSAGYRGPGATATRILRAARIPGRGFLALGELSDMEDRFPRSARSVAALVLSAVPRFESRLIAQVRGCRGGGCPTRDGASFSALGVVLAVVLSNLRMSESLEWGLRPSRWLRCCRCYCHYRLSVGKARMRDLCPP